MLDRRMLNGWPLLGWLSLALAAAGLALAGSHGFAVDGIRLAIRVTARTSLILFTLAFSAGAVRVLWPNAWTLWQRRNRRFLGLAFAFSHAVHAAAIAAFASLDPILFHQLSNPGSMVTGGIAYGFIVALALTSFDRSAAWLGPRGWRALHWIGGYYIWISFIVTNGKRIGLNPAYALPVVLMLIVLGLRVAAWRATSGLSARLDPPDPRP